MKSGGRHKDTGDAQLQLAKTRCSCENDCQARSCCTLASWASENFQPTFDVLRDEALDSQLSMADVS